MSLRPSKIRPAPVAHHPVVLEAPAVHGVLEQALGDDQALLVAARLHLDDDVLELGVEGHRLVRRQGPGGGGPDHQMGRALAAAVGGGVAACLQRLRVEDLEAHVDGDGLLVRIVHLGLGQGGSAVDTPVDRLLALHHMAVGDDPPQGADDLRLEGEVHGEIGPLPVSQDAEPLEVGALAVHLLGGIFPAGDPKLGRADLVAGLALLLLHLELDGQAVTVPARHVGGVQPIEGAGLHDDVLEHLVDRVTDVDLAVGVGRPVVEDETLGPRPRLADQAIEVHGLPGREHRGLALGQVGFHREARVGEVQGVFVVSHGFRSWSVKAVYGARECGGRVRCALPGLRCSEGSRRMSRSARRW